MPMMSGRVRRALVGLVAALIVVGLAPAAPSPEAGPVKVQASEATHAVDKSHEFRIEPDTTHIAIRWTGHPTAEVHAAFSRDGSTFEEPVHVEVDEVGAARHDGVTYGALISVTDMRVVRVTADRPLAQVTVLSLDAAAEIPAVPGLGATAAGVNPIPGVIPRAGWGADETIRFDQWGEERWWSQYFPLQKLIVHHTAGSNGDSNPAATVRAVYHYHAVTQNWGDIGYNYLIDSAGRIYEGRHSREYWYGASPTSDNADGDVIAGGHALYHNAGTMGIALLGTFNSQAPTTAARAALINLLAWAASTHGINPVGATTYLNPVNGYSRNTHNIAGHRDYNQTGCPGLALYNLLPSIRASVAALVNSWPGEVYNPPRTLSLAAGLHTGYRFSPAGAVTATKAFTLGAASSAPTGQRATIPGQASAWYYITAGVWAGYWIQESARTGLGPPPAEQVGESYLPWRSLHLAAGAYVGYRFNSYGTVLASKAYTLATGSAARTTEKSTIPGQAGSWYFITAGVWDGYWIQESAGTVLGDPPPPPPPPVVENYDPPKILSFAAGTYTGRQFNATGGITASKPYTLAAASAAPTSQKSTIPNQSGNWYYVTAGVWAGYWIAEGAGISLGDAPPPPPPPVVENYDPPKILSFAAGTYIGRQFNAAGGITASKPYTLAAASAAPTNQKSTIPNQSGNWYYITAGVWAGYWIQESAGTVLGDPPPPPLPPVVENYDPPRTLYFAAGNYVGRQFNAAGAITASKPYTLAAASAAPTSQKSTIPNQSGNWYYITAGVWAGYWIQESAGTTLSDP